VTITTEGPKSMQGLQKPLDWIETSLRTTTTDLDRWLRVYYAVGLAAVTLAAAAGISGLAELLSIQVAGAIALGSAVLGAIDKWLAAAGKVNDLTIKKRKLVGLNFQASALLEEGQRKQDRLDALPESPDRQKKQDAIYKWADDRTKELNAAIAQYNNT
jgi:hypothetical protein